jgi:polar amino acid transport system substrate-binding protein
MKRFPVPLAIAISLIVVAAACSPATTPTPAAPTATTAPSESATASATASASASSPVVAQVPADQLNFPGKLLVCIDIPYPPQEFFDAQGNPTGSDVDIATEIANRLGLQVQVINSVFDTIILAVNGGKCDIIVSAQNINADRIKAVDMIPYFRAGQSFVVAKGNPKAVKAEADLCGLKIGTESGTTEADYVAGTGDYKGGGGLIKVCSTAGKPAPVSVTYKKDSDALLALTAGQVDVYFADSPVAGFYTVNQPGAFDLAPIPPINSAVEGISVPQAKTGLRDAVMKALLSMINDGKYVEILKRYGVQDGALKATEIVVNKISA